MATMNISLPDQMKEWVEDQTADGNYANASDYIRDLVRRDMLRSEGIARLQAEIDNGRAGPSARSIRKTCSPKSSNTPRPPSRRPMRLDLSAEARRDLEEIHLYGVREHGERAADAYLARASSSPPLLSSTSATDSLRSVIRASTASAT